MTGCKMVPPLQRSFGMFGRLRTLWGVCHFEVSALFDVPVHSKLSENVPDIAVLRQSVWLHIPG